MVSDQKGAWGRCTERVSCIQAPIRKISTMARELKEKGVRIYPLNIGDPNKFDFETPAYLQQALKDSSGAGWYSESEGDSELVKSISDWINGKYNANITPSDVVVTSGISEGVSWLMEMFLEPGDDILVPDPGFPQYFDAARLRGGNPVSYRCDEENCWQPDTEDIRNKITDRTKFMLIINPNNPTGAVYDRKIIKELVDIAGENQIPVVSDEIYDQLTDKTHTSPIQVSKDVPVIYLNGFSKAYLVPGWRCGYMAFYDPAGKFAEGLEKDYQIPEGAKKLARMRLSMATPIMKACARAYTGPQDHIKELNRKLRERGEFAYRRLNEIEGVSAQKPDGAFYIFPKIELGGKWKDDEEFVLDLLNKTGVATVYGSGFGEYGTGHLRSVILPKVDVLGEAFDKLEEYMMSR